MKKKYIIFLILLLASNLFSQENSFITGKVTVDNDVLIMGVTISVYQNGELITGASTDINGEYRIALKKGIYTIDASYIGYANEQIKIEIKANETQTINFKLSFARYDIVTVFDTVILNTIELNKIDKKIKIAINYHIKTARNKIIFPNKKRNVILVKLYDINYDYYSFLNKDDIKLKHQQFKENNFGDGYNLYISFLNRNNLSIYGLKDKKNIYHYKYNNWDVFFITYIDDLEFPFTDSPQKYEFQLEYKDIEINKNGKYEKMFHKKLYKYWDKAIPYKRHENYFTHYYITNFDVIMKIIKVKYLLKSQDII